MKELAEATGLEAASVRVALRALDVEKTHGNQYGWDNKKDLDEIVKAMKERSAKRVAPAKPKEEAKPAPAAKKSTSKKKAPASA